MTSFYRCSHRLIMSTNAFAALGHEKKKPAASEKAAEDAESMVITTDVSDAAVENTEWQPAVTDKKARRLVPQSSQARPSEPVVVASTSSPTKTGGSSDAAKKKGERRFLASK